LHFCTKLSSGPLECSFDSSAEYFLSNFDNVSPNKRKNLSLIQSVKINSFPRKFTRTGTLRFWQTCRKFFANSLEKFHPKPGNSWTTSCSRKEISWIRSSGHTLYSIDNPVHEKICQSRKVFRPMFEKIYIGKIFWTKCFCWNWSHRHVECSFENPVLKLFAENPKSFRSKSENFHKLKNFS